MDPMYDIVLHMHAPDQWAWTLVDPVTEQCWQSPDDVLCTSADQALLEARTFMFTCTDCSLQEIPVYH